MVDQTAVPATSKASWQPKQLAIMCAVCLATGLLVGYLLRGSAASPVQPVAASEITNPPAQAMGQPTDQPQMPQGMPKQMPSLDDMKRMADKKAEPLLAKLKTDGKNPGLLNQIGLVYKSTHQFKEAAEYFDKSLQSDPKNIGVRADYASCLFYTGDVDGALAQLDKALTYDPKHAGTLMNIGIIRWKGKNDPNGAADAWKKLLQYHPDFPQKDMVEHMIKEVTQPSPKMASNAPTQ